MFVFMLVSVLPLLFTGVKAENLAFVSAYNAQAIYKASLPADSFNGSFAFTKVLTTFTKPKQIGYDPVDGKIYWVEFRHVGRCNLDGSNYERQRVNDRGWGLALDITNRIIYVSDWTTHGVSSLAIGDFGTANAHSSIAGTAITDSEPKSVSFGKNTNSLYVTYTADTTKELNKYNVDGTGKSTLVSSGLGDRPVGLFVDEETEELFYSSRRVIWSYNLQDSTKTRILEASGNFPKGMDVYGCTLYFTDFKGDSLYKISKYGSKVKTEVQYTLDEGTLDGCFGIYFYIENSNDRYQELPRINFEVNEIGAVCEGDSVDVTLTNVGHCSYNMSVDTVDGTAVAGEDFEMKTNTVTLLPMETAIYEIDILASEICEHKEENFEIVVYDDNSTLISNRNNNTVNVTITSDLQCGKSAVKFDDPSIGPVCEGSSISATLSNAGSCNHTVSVASIDGTAIGDVDFETTTDVRFTIEPGENVTYEIVIHKDADFETAYETFELQVIIHHQNGTVITNGNKANVTIPSDDDCGNLAFVVARPVRSIYKASLPTDSFDGSFTFTKVINTTQAPRQVVYDHVDRKLYWTEYGYIGRCDLSGSNYERYRANHELFGLALDLTSRIIYFTDFITNGVSSLAIRDFGTADAHSLIAGTVINKSKPRAIYFGKKSNSLYVTHSRKTLEINKYSVDGTVKTTLLSSDEGDTMIFPTYIFVDEETEELYYSDLIVPKENRTQIRSFNLQDSTTTNLYEGTIGARGMDVYGCTLYYCDSKQDRGSLYKISKYGSANKTEVKYTLDEGSLDGCRDIHFYIKNSSDRYYETPSVHFDKETNDPVCEGSSISATLTNSGFCNHTVTFSTFNGTALGGEDFEITTDKFTIQPAEKVTYEIDILKDEEFETSEETFRLMIIDHQDNTLITSDTLDISISSDNGCDKKIVNIVRAYFGGFHGKVVFTIDYDVSDWYVKLMFVRGVWKLEMLDCGAEVRHVLRQPGSHRTFYTLGPNSETGTLRKGDKLRIEFIATTSKKLRGMPTRAIFVPL